MDDRFRKQLWLIPLAILVHNVEEYVALNRFTALKNFPIASEQILIAQIIITIAVILLLIAGYNCKKNSKIFQFTLLIIPGLLINAATHIAQIGIFRMYTPGGVSAILILLPLGLFLLMSAIEEEYIKRGELLKLFITAAFVLIASLVLAQIIAVIILNIL